MLGSCRPHRVLICAVCLLLFAGGASAQTLYVAFGDSITEGVGDDPSRAERGYPPRLEDLLQAAGQDAEVINRGVGAEKTLDGLSRIDEVLDEGGDVLLLMEGTNDLTRFVSIETILFNLNEMAKRAEARGWEAIHATVLPRIPDARVDPRNISNQKLNQRIRELAGNNGRDLADNFEVFGSRPDPFATHYLEDPQDHVGHPNARGYDLMAQTFFDVIVGNDSVPPVPGRLSPSNGAVEINPASRVDMDVWDFGAGIDLAETTLVLNGVEVPAELTGNSKRAHLRYQPPRPFQGTIRMELHSQDMAQPPNVTTREVARFVIAGFDEESLPGDVDGDGRVDGIDLVELGLAFGAARGDSRYAEAADLDKSGVVNGQDLAILAANFGQSAPPAS